MNLVVFALREEAVEFLKWNKSGSVKVEYIGVGEKAVRNNLPALLKQHQPKILICAGFAGALTNELKPGEAFVAVNRTNFHDVSSPLRSLRLHSADGVVCSESERNKIVAETDCLAVDMEAETVFNLARAAGIPILTIRVISDTPNASIPIPFEVSYDLQRQKVRKWAVAWWLASHPLEIPDFILFLVRLKTARLNLAIALARTLDQLAQPPAS